MLLKLKLKQFALALLLINSVASANEPSGVFSLDKDECIILVASTKSETEARAIAKKYPGSELYTSKSGYIAVGLEKISKQQSSARIGELLSAGKIPKGSNCADGTRITGLLDRGSNSVSLAEKENSKPEITAAAAGPIEYTHYNDGSCTPDANKKCVSKEQLAALCKKTSAWYTNVFGLIGVADNFIDTLYRNSGASAFKNGSVYVAKSGQCAFKFDAIGMINGTSYNRTYYCVVTTIVDDGKRKGGSLAVSSVSSFGCVQ